MKDWTKRNEFHMKHQCGLLQKCGGLWDVRTKSRHGQEHLCGFSLHMRVSNLLEIGWWETSYLGPPSVNKIMPLGCARTSHLRIKQGLSKFIGLSWIGPPWQSKRIIILRQRKIIFCGHVKPTTLPNPDVNHKMCLMTLFTKCPHPSSGKIPMILS